MQSGLRLFSINSLPLAFIIHGHRPLLKDSQQLLCNRNLAGQWECTVWKQSQDWPVKVTIVQILQITATRLVCSRIVALFSAPWNVFPVPWVYICREQNRMHTQTCTPLLPAALSSVAPISLLIRSTAITWQLQAHTKHVSQSCMYGKSTPTIGHRL